MLVLSRKNLFFLYLLRVFSGLHCVAHPMLSEFVFSVYLFPGLCYMLHFE